jgi:peptidoglycan hydrolase-like protein with peptidoglycan-binding domain
MRIPVLVLAVLLLLAAPAAATIGDDEEMLVRAVQESLLVHGYNPGPIDGRIGPLTRGAIRAFQEDRGLEVDGQPSEALFEELIRPDEPPEPPEPDMQRAELVPLPEPDPGPRWRVLAGHVEPGEGLGLHSTVRSPTGNGPARPEELALLVVGSLAQREPATWGPPRRALAHLEQPLPADFAIAFDLEVEVASGVLDIGPYVGAERVAGYRLTWLRGERERLELRQVSPQGYVVLGHADDTGGPLLLPGRTHRLRWSRNPDGRMRVSLDGRTVIEVADRAHPAGFDGLLLQNLGGSYTLGGLAIDP